MADKIEILIALKKRLALGEITPSEYNELKAEISADEASQAPSARSFDVRSTFQGIGTGSVLKGRYEVIIELGRGGMGVVYKAKDLELNTITAVKVLNEELARDGRSVRNLMEEAKISMRLTHPHIMRLINFESDDRRKFLVMEFIDGETLEARLSREGRIPEFALAPIAADICDGLSYAHKQKIIHRDIKPSNVMLTAAGEVKIMDFGIARVMKDSMTMVTGRMTTGTLIYMSPEQIEGRDVDGRSDLYSLGIMLYELAAGNPPFYQGDITHQHLKVEPKKILGVSERFSEIVLKCLEKDKSKRYSSAAELYEVFEGRQETELERAAKNARERAGRESTEREDERSARIQTIWMEAGRKEEKKREGVRLNEDPAAESTQNPIDSSGLSNVESQGGRKTDLRNIPASRVLDPEMVWIPGGTFSMGADSSEADIDEKPVHEVNISAFSIGKYEVTQAEWATVMGSNPSYIRGDDLPVENVSWKEVQVFIQKLKAATGKNYRLPTEAEWEFACRAGTLGDRYGELDAIAWYIGNSDNRTHPVGMKEENPFGLFDMLGNVWEWCEDRYGPYPEEAAIYPRGPSKGACRVCRGGSWDSDAQGVRGSYRLDYDPSDRDNNLGFRLARD